VKIGLIDVDGKNARVIDKKTDEWKSFVQSIAAGVEVPLIVKINSDRFDLVAGHRRLEAAKEAKLEVVPCDVRENITEADMAEIRVIENLQRKDLSPIEEGLQIKALLSKADETNTVESLAERLGKSRPWVIRRAKLADLDPSIVKDLKKGEMKAWSIEALVLLACQPVEMQVKLVDQYHWRAPSEKELNDSLAKSRRDLSKAPFDPADETLKGTVKLTCVKCTQRTGAAPDLFDVKASKGLGLCVNSGCYQAKVAEFGKKFIAATLEKNADTVLISQSYSVCTDYPKAILNGVYVKAKKDSPKAIRALCVETLEWKYVTMAKAATTNKGRKIDETGKVIAKSQKEKEAGLFKRRAFLVIEKIKAAIMKCAFADTTTGANKGYRTRELIQMIVCFGAYGASGGHRESEWLKELDHEAVLDSGWKQVRDRMYKFIHIPQPSLLRDVQVDVAKKIAVLIHQDWAALMVDAEKEIPTPKSWTKKADAKPEKKATKPKAKKPKAEKTATPF
jgi:ParB/RepB/Spo0J family partition protein